MESSEIEKKFDNSREMRRLTPDFIQNSPIGVSDYHLGVKILDCVFMQKLEQCFINTCISSIKANVITTNKVGSAEFDVIAYTYAVIVFIGEFKSWINLKKLKEDIARVKLGMKENAFVVDLYYFIGSVVIDNESEKKNWIAFLGSTDVKCYEIVLKKQDIDWTISYMASIKSNVGILRTRSRCVKLIKNSFSFVFNNIHNIIRNNILRNMGLRRKALVDEEIEFQNNLLGDRLIEFRENKDICRNHLLKSLKTLKDETLDFFRFYDKMKSNDVFVFLKNNLNKFGLLKKTKQIVHFRNIGVVKRFYAWIIDMCENL
jgi:hypothetical protein